MNEFSAVLFFDLYDITKKQEYLDKAINYMYEYEKLVAQWTPGKAWDGILKARQDAKLNKNTILWDGMFNYGRYGARSPFTNLIQEEELLNINPEELTDIIKNLTEFKHHMFLYSERDLNEASVILDQFHKVSSTLDEYPEPITYEEVEYTENKVYFVD